MKKIKRKSKESKEELIKRDRRVKERRGENRR